MPLRVTAYIKIDASSPHVKNKIYCASEIRLHGPFFGLTQFELQLRKKVSSKTQLFLMHLGQFDIRSVEHPDLLILAFFTTHNGELQSYRHPKKTQRMYVAI